MHVKFYQGSSAIEDLFPFDNQNFNDFFSVVRHNFVSNGWNLKKLILNIYDHSVVMHVTFHRGVIRYR